MMSPCLRCTKATANIVPETYRYMLLHAGFGDFSYAYCDCCGMLAAFAYTVQRSREPAANLPNRNQVIDARLGSLILRPCSCGGHFRKGASPRCVYCNSPLSADMRQATLSATQSVRPVDGAGKETGATPTAWSSKIPADPGHLRQIADPIIRSPIQSEKRQANLGPDLQLQPMKIGVVSDTHGLLRPEVLPALAGVEHILHLGDVGSPSILKSLGRDRSRPRSPRQHRSNRPLQPPSRNRRPALREPLPLPAPRPRHAPPRSGRRQSSPPCSMATRTDQTSNTAKACSTSTPAPAARDASICP